MKRRAFLGTLAAAAAPAEEPWSARLGVMCQLAPAESEARSVLAAARQAGFRRVQVFFPWDKVGAAYLRALPAWLGAEDLRCDVLSAYVNCVEPSTVLMSTRAGDFARALDHAADMKCRRLAAWTGGYVPDLMTTDERNFTTGARDAIVRFLEPHLGRLEQAGLEVALESYITLACPDAPSLRALLDRLPAQVGAVLDPPNFTPLARYAERDRVLGEAVRLLAGRISVVHLKDFQPAPGGRGYELPGPLLGGMNYPLFVDYIRKLPGTLPVIAEHVKPANFGETRRALLRLFGS